MRKTGLAALFLAALAFVLCLTACNGGATPSQVKMDSDERGARETQPVYDSGTSAASLPHVGKLDGVCFTPYMEGQSAETTIALDDKQIRERLAQIAPYTRSISTFGSLNGLERIPRIAFEEFGLEVAAGAWICDDLEANSKQIDNLVDNAPYISLAVIGNETINLEAAGADVLLGALREARQKLDENGGAHIPVTTDETYAKLLEHPEIIDACDVVMLSYHPYFEEPDPHKAATRWLPETIKQIRELAKGKPFIIGESGWASFDQSGDDVAGRQRAITYITNAVAQARSAGVFMFVFASHCESWKVRVEGKHADSWGILTVEGALKYDPMLFDDRFADATAPQLSLAGALKGAMTAQPPPVTPSPAPVGVPEADEPGVSIERWPDKLDMSVAGQVVGIDDPNDYRMMLWIRVAGAWWPKPTYDTMMQQIERDGRFLINALSHPNDVNADDFIVMLVHESHLSDGADMNASLKEALAYERMGED